MRPLRGAPLAAVAALVVAGCGGISNADFARRADAICTQFNRTAPGPLGPKVSSVEAVRYATREIQLRTGLDAKLRMLTVPEDLKGDFVTFNADTQQLIAIVRRRRAAAVANDVKRYQQLVRMFGTVALGRERYAMRLGFQVCGRTRAGGPQKSG